jgi:hypothetical protein
MKIDWEFPIYAIAITLCIITIFGGLFYVDHIGKEKRLRCMELFADKPTVEIMQLCK